MEFALNVPNFGSFADPAAMTDLAVLAEESGWDGFFVWDHIAIADRYRIADPWVMLSAVAAATDRMKIGPMVTPLPRRRPWVVARQAATLDHLSGGRLVLGVGIGAPPEAEFGTFGEPTDARTRGQMLDESLDIITGMWSGEPFSYDGEHFTVREMTFLPRPHQRPRIPIWVAGRWPNRPPFLRAAGYEGVCPLGDQNGTPGFLALAEIVELVDEITEIRGNVEGYEVCVPIQITEDDERDRETIAAYGDAGVTWVQIGPAGEGETIEEVRDWIATWTPLR